MHYLTISVPQQNHTWLGNSIGPMMRSLLSAVEDFLEDQDEGFYTTGIQALRHRWKKCVDRRGEYVDNYRPHLVNSTIAS